MDEEKIVEVKRKANEFIWQNGRPEMTLEDAEAAACALLEAMYPGAIPDYDGHACASHRERRLDAVVE